MSSTRGASSGGIMNQMLDFDNSIRNNMTLYDFKSQSQNPEPYPSPAHFNKHANPNVPAVAPPNHSQGIYKGANDNQDWQDTQNESGLGMRTIDNRLNQNYYGPSVLPAEVKKNTTMIAIYGGILGVLAYHYITKYN